MPIYEYRCSSCGHELEALQKLSEALLIACPSCKANALVKQVSAAGFQLKGSGWYATDFKGGAKPAGKPDDSKPADAKPDSAPDKKTDAAPAAKPESTAPASAPKSTPTST